MTAVRYFSRSGHTKAVAEAIAEAAGTQAVSVDSENAAISKPVDILFIGAAIYAYGLDKHMKKFLSGIEKENVKKAVVFSTSRFSKHGLALLKKAMQEKGIPVVDETFYAKGNPGSDDLEAAKRFAQKFI